MRPGAYGSPAHRIHTLAPVSSSRPPGRARAEGQPDRDRSGRSGNPLPSRVAQFVVVAQPYLHRGFRRFDLSKLADAFCVASEPSCRSCGAVLDGAFMVLSHAAHVRLGWERMQISQPRRGFILEAILWAGEIKREPRDLCPRLRRPCGTLPAMWWIVGIIAIGIIVGTLTAVWAGRAISHADQRESSAELRCAPTVEEKPNRCRE